MAENIGPTKEQENALKEKFKEYCECLRDDPEGNSFRIRILADAPQVDISSTEIRKGLEEGLDMSEYLM